MKGNISKTRSHVDLGEDYSKGCCRHKVKIVVYQVKKPTGFYESITFNASLSKFSFSIDTMFIYIKWMVLVVCDWYAVYRADPNSWNVY